MGDARIIKTGVFISFYDNNDLFPDILVRWLSACQAFGKPVRQQKTAGQRNELHSLAAYSTVLKLVPMSHP